MEQAAFIATLPRADARRAMAAYVRDFARTGALPGFNAETRARLLEGTYVERAKEDDARDAAGP
jgi:hypothetical protein